MIDDDTVKVARLKERYEALLHAVQSGVKWERQAEVAAGVPEDSMSSGPKHLRTGINSALLQTSSLATLLIRKGLITELEFWEAQIEFWEAEVERYEQNAKRVTGVEISFH